MKGFISFARQFTTVLILGALAAPVFALGDNGLSRKTKPLTEDQKIIHVLNRLGFGARPGDVEKVRAIGVQKYIEQQLNPSSIDDAKLESKVKPLDIFNMSTAGIFETYPNPAGLLRQLEGGRAAQANKEKAAADNEMTADQKKERAQKLAEYYREYNLKPASQILPQITANRVLRAVYSEKQLQEVMVDFWQNHFNVFSGKNAVRWMIPSYERDVLRKNALGNFKDLLVGTAQHPAMLFYLDNFESISPNAGNNNNKGNARLQKLAQNGQLTPAMRERIKQNRGIDDAQLDKALNQMKQQSKNKRGINENYARELMELHTLGVDGGYTQQDIIEVAKCFTGWTIADPRGYRRAAANEIQEKENKALAKIQKMAGVPDDLESGEFYFNPTWHEGGTKTVLGQKINEGGMKDGLKVLDLLVAQPQTAKFIARKLAVKFVSDNPNEELVDRVAKAFTESKGDIKSTLRALFTDKEFFAPENYRAKIKTPFELAVSAVRVIGADTNGGRGVLAMLNKLGEIPYGYQAPTGYPDTAEDWVNAGALLERLNYAIALAANQIPGTKADLRRFEAPSKEAVLDKTIASVLDGDVSAKTRETLLKQMNQPLPEVKAPDEVDDDPETPAMRPGGKGGRNQQLRLLAPSGNGEVVKVVSLVLGTPEFQRQ